MIKIVPAREENVADLVALNSEVQKIHAERYPNIFRYPVDDSVMGDEFLSKLLDKNQQIYVAEKNENIVGYIWYQFFERPESVLTYAARKLYIHHIAVAEQHRSEGVGKQLMAHISKEAKERSVQHVALDVWSFNSGAEKFFKKNGYEVFSSNMWKHE